MSGYEVISGTGWSWEGRTYPPFVWVEVRELDAAKEIKRGTPDLQVRPLDRWADPSRYSIDILTQRVICVPRPAGIPAGNPPVAVIAPTEPPVSVAPLVTPKSTESETPLAVVVPTGSSEEAKETLPDMSFDDEPTEIEARIRAAVPKLAPEVLVGALEIIEQKPADLVDALQSVKGIGKSTAVKIAEAVTNG